MTRPRTADIALPVVLGVSVFVYLRFFWPNSLVPLDEGAFLYEGKRVLDGQVMYRDFFDLTGPLAQYALALAYALFGVSMETARGTTALLHGVIVLLVFAISRRLGVRPWLAAAFCLVDPVLFFPALPFASPHWFSTTFTLVVFWFVLRGPLGRSGAVTAGALTALVAVTQQPKGVALAAAVVIVLIRDAWTEGKVLPQLASYAAGLVGVAGAVLIGMVATAGFAPVFDALVRTPLGPYRDQPFVREGHWLLRDVTLYNVRRIFLIAPSIFVLNLLPLIIPVSIARLIARALRRERTQESRAFFVAVVFVTAGFVSILYQLNHAHFGVVGPIWLPIFAETTERLVRRLDATFPAAVAGPLATLGVLALVTFEWYRSFALAWAGAGAWADTAFGRVHFHSAAEVEDVESLRTTLRAAGAKDLFVYPCAAALYLMTETSNPTRFQLLIPGYNTDAQFDEVQGTLERDHIPFVVRSFWFWGKPGDPLQPYLDAHYEPVKLARTHAGMPSLTLLRRKPPAPAR